MWKQNKLKRIDSTQKEAIRKIKDRKITKPEYFLSFDQFNGYGTRGKKWEKCKHSFAITFVWPSSLSPKLSKTLLPILVSIKTVEALEKFSNLPCFTLGLKWPNDLIKSNKKIGGVIVQTVNYHGNEWIVAGIGVNLIWDPPPINDYFGSLLKINEVDFSKEQLILLISESMKEFFDLVDVNDTIHQFNARDIFKGKKVKINFNKKEYFGKNCGIAENGGICLEQQKGNSRIFKTGSLSLL